PGNVEIIRLLAVQAFGTAQAFEVQDLVAVDAIEFGHRGLAADAGDARLAPCGALHLARIEIAEAAAERQVEVEHHFLAELEAAAALAQHEKIAAVVVVPVEEQQRDV